MAITKRSAAADLKSSEANIESPPQTPRRDDVATLLFEKGYLFDFFQSVWMLEHALARTASRGEQTAAAEERIRIRPHEGVAFPASDVRKIEWLDEEKSRAQVTVTFMGLYGVASPLPVYFYNPIGTRQEGAESLRDFLDMFNRRLYKYFYQAWKKYQPRLHPRSSSREHDARVFTCLAGLGTSGFVKPPQIAPGRLMGLAGLLSSGVRNAYGLQTVLSTMFDGLQVRIRENVARWVTMHTRPRIGDRSMTLGGGAIIGRKVRDVSGKFRVTLGPLGLKRFRTFLPDGQTAGLLNYLINLYTTDQLDYDVELLLKTSEVPAVKLGGPQKLGVDAWLGRPAGDVISVVVQYPRTAGPA